MDAEIAAAWAKWQRWSFGLLAVMGALIALQMVVDRHESSELMPQVATLGIIMLQTVASVIILVWLSVLGLGMVKVVRRHGRWEYAHPLHESPIGDRLRWLAPKLVVLGLLWVAWSLN